MRLYNVVLVVIPSEPFQRNNDALRKTFLGAPLTLPLHFNLFILVRKYHNLIPMIITSCQLNLIGCN